MYQCSAFSAISWLMTILEPTYDRHITHPLWFRRAVALTFPISIPLILLLIVIFALLGVIELLLRSVIEVVVSLWRAP